MTFFRKAGPVFLFSLCALTPAILAQSDRGTINGTVRDSSGAVIPGAKVVVTNTATNFAERLVSNEAGDFNALSLPTGNYNVQVSKDGFRPFEIKGITLDAASTIRADANLEVGQSQQAIEVQATAASLHTEDAKASVTI